MRSGLVRITVTMWFKSVFSNSSGATILSSPISLRNLWALCFKMAGPYVSGKNQNSGQVTPARIAPIQNPQFHETTETKPETRGPRIGPNVVAAYHTISFPSNTSLHPTHTMKIAILLPLLTGSCQISAQMPPTTLIAQLPPIPTNSLNTTSAAKFGASADAIEKIVRMAKEYTIVPLRP